MYARVCLQAIQTDGHPGRLTYVQSADQVWIEQTLDDPQHHQQQQQQQQNGREEHTHWRQYIVLRLGSLDLAEKRLLESLRVAKSQS